MIILAYFDIPNDVFATGILIAEIILMVLLFIGWYKGARRLNIDLHHYIVYSVTIIANFLFLIWMAPKITVDRYFSIISNFPDTYKPTIHMTLGLIVLILMITVSGIFIVNRDININRLKRYKPLMIIIAITFPIVVFTGFLLYMKYL